MMKKVAGTFSCFRMSRIAGVHLGSGPSSKVNASKPGRSPVRWTTYDDGRAVNCSDLMKPLAVSISRSRAFLRARRHAQQFAVAFEVDFVTVVDRSQNVGRTVLRTINYGYEVD